VPTISDDIKSKNRKPLFANGANNGFRDGWVPNNIRVYWDKQVVGWRGMPPGGVARRVLIDRPFRPRRAQRDDLRQHLLELRQIKPPIGRAGNIRQA